MSPERGHRTLPFTLNRRMVAASAAVSRERNTVHGLCWVEVTEPQRLLREHRDRSGEALSFTAYVVACLARAIAENPQLNALRRRRRLILLDKVTIGVLIERMVGGETVPELLPIRDAQDKSCRQIHDEIRAAQNRTEQRVAGPSRVSPAARFLPDSLLRLAVRVASRRVSHAQRFGVVAVSSVGLFGRNGGWGMPLSVWTVMVTIGGIARGPIPGNVESDASPEQLCLTFSFDHDIVDGGPGTRFMSRVAQLIRSGDLLRDAVATGGQ